MKGLFRSFFTVSFYTILSRILGFVRDIFIAKYLGSTVTADAFFVAFRLPNFFRRISFKYWLLDFQPTKRLSIWPFISEKLFFPISFLFL